MEQVSSPWVVVFQKNLEGVMMLLLRGVLSDTVVLLETILLEEIILLQGRILL